MKVFFYGLFMDETLLAAKGLYPDEARTGYVEDFSLRIAERATLLRCPGDRVYGIVMDLPPNDVTKLYSEASVSEYLPEPVVVELMNGATVDATCYNLPLESVVGANPDYAKSLLNVATELGFPDSYLDRIRQAAS